MVVEHGQSHVPLNPVAKLFHKIFVHQTIVGLCEINLMFIIHVIFQSEIFQLNPQDFYLPSYMKAQLTPQGSFSSKQVIN